MSEGYIDRNVQRVYHILQRASEIRNRIRELSYEAFVEDSTLVDATLYKLTVIGEAIRADGFISRIEEQFGYKVNVICTGG